MITVRELMTTDPDTVSPETPLREVVARMNRDGCRQLPVLDEGVLVGLVTDRDVRLMLNSPMLPHLGEDRTTLLGELDAASCMTGSPVTVPPGMPAGEAADLLRLNKFGAVPVVEDGALVGVLSTSDFLEWFSANDRGARTG